MRKTREDGVAGGRWRRASDSEEVVEGVRCAEGRSEMGLSGRWRSGRSVLVLV